MSINVHLWNSMFMVVAMMVSSILAYRQITKLDINDHIHSLLDDLLLVICMPAFFLNGIFTLIPAVVEGNGMSISYTILEVPCQIL